MATSAISFSLLVLAAAAGALADMPPCLCTKEYDPVCGTDRQTYPNLCELDCAKSKLGSKPGLALAHVGPCAEVSLRSRLSALVACPCPRIFSPVCGTDSRTYVNHCELNCAKENGQSPKGHALSVDHDGACVEVTTRSAVPATIAYLCPKMNAPVCGTDSRTYGNRCLLHLAGARGLSPKGSALAVAHEGACDADKLRCPMFWEPVCGNDGHTYDNLCMLNGAKVSGKSSKGDALEVVHNGSCEEPSAGIQLLSNVADHGLVQPLPKACRCPFIYKPVCGTDSVTYPSECTLGCSRAMGTSIKGANLRVKYAGVC